MAKLPRLSAGRRPASRGGPGGRSPPGTMIQNYNYITTVFYNLKNLNNLNNIINIIILFLYNLNKAGWPAGRPIYRIQNSLKP